MIFSQFLTTFICFWFSINYIDSDISSNTTTEAISYLNELHTAVNRSTSITWSITGDTDLSYSLVQNGVNPLPSWVGLDSTNQLLTLNTPDVTVSGSFSLQIKSTAFYYSDNKVVSIGVVECTELSCEQCTSIYNEWSIWDSGYTLNTTTLLCEEVIVVSNSTQISSEVRTAQTASQAAVGASVGIGTIAAILSSSSSNSAFASINQFQLYMLVPLLGTGLHKNVIDYITGFKFTAFSFDIIDFQTVPGLQMVMTYFEFQNSDQYLSKIGISSLSTTLNLFSTLLIFTLLFLCHILLVLPVYSCLRRRASSDKLQRLGRALMQLFTFTIYIRMGLESYQLMAMSGLNEICNSGKEQTAQAVSLGITWVLLIISVIMIFGVFWLVEYSFKVKFDKDESYFKEFLNGVKNTKWARIYFSVFMLRRLLSITLTIPLEFVPIYAKIVWFVLIHISVTGYIIKVRPYDSPKDNVIEVINEIGFSILILSLFYFSSDSQWTTGKANLVVYSLLLLSMITTIVAFSCLIAQFTKWVYKRWTNKKKLKVKPIRSETNVSASNVTQNEEFIYRSNIQTVSKRYTTTERMSTDINPKVLSMETIKPIQSRKNVDIFEQQVKDNLFSHMFRSDNPE